MYTDENNGPYARKSRNERRIDVEVGGSKTAGWRSNTFELDGSIEEGTSVWFGVYSDYFSTRFDYGGECYKLWPDWDLYPDGDDLKPFININPQWDVPMNIKFSWYCTYEGVRAHTRTLTQGVKLTGTPGRIAAYRRKAIDVIPGLAAVKGPGSFFRYCASSLTISASLRRAALLLRPLPQAVRAPSVLLKSRAFMRRVSEILNVASVLHRTQGFVSRIAESVRAHTSLGSALVRLRILFETGGVPDSSGHIASLHRRMEVKAHTGGEAAHEGNYYRGNADTVYPAGISLRHVFVRVKLHTSAFIRHILKSRFLKSNEELVLQSPISRELVLDSAII